MKFRIVSGIIALLMFVGATGVAAAAYDDKDDTTRSVTGCLQKGDEASEFTLMAKDGSTWDVKSDTVNLAPHVGHTVTITAEPSRVHAKAHEMKEKTKSEMQEHGMAKNETEHGHLKVTKLTMVSDTCKQ